MLAADISPCIFTLSIGDRPVLAFPASGLGHARKVIKEALAHDELTALNSSLAPVLDGREKLNLRSATDDEISVYLIRAGEAGEDLVFALLEDMTEKADARHRARA